MFFAVLIVIKCVGTLAADWRLVFRVYTLSFCLLISSHVPYYIPQKKVLQEEMGNHRENFRRVIFYLILFFCSFYPGTESTLAKGGQE